jgi:hypothetical protein
MARSFIRPCRPRAQKSNAEREIVVVANELIRRAAGKLVAPGLRIKAQQMVFVSFSDPQFADDTAFGKQLLHLVARSLLLRDCAFVQLSVPFSAGSESISFSLSNSTHIQWIGNSAIIKISAGHLPQLRAVTADERNGNVVLHGK